MTIVFHALGDPKPQPRPRAFARKFDGVATARVYDPGTAEGWKSAVAEAARPHLPPEPLQGPLLVTLVFRFQRPKSHFGTKGIKPSAPAEHLQRPDVDNLAKAVLDCLTTLRVWADDDQIVGLETRKSWASDTQRGGCMVEIDRLTVTAGEGRAA